MSNEIKIKIESRQQSNKKIKNKNIFSSNTLGSINKENTEKKILKDLSLNFLKYFSTTSLTNKTCINHNHKKILIKEKRFINNKNITLKNNHKFIKFPLKLNHKQSISLKNLVEEENLLNVPMRSSDKRKNTNTKIELFSTNSTLSFLNIKDNNKDLSKPVKIKCFNNDTFIEKKIKSKVKSNSKLKIKHIKNSLNSHKKIKINLQKNKKLGIKENIFNNSNKSIEFCLSYMKPINKRRNLSIGLNDNSNSNTNSINELYNKKIKKKNLNYSNLLFNNMSFSLNNLKNKNEFGYGYKNGNTLYNNKNGQKNFYKINTINNGNKKNNLSSLPNLLCNNYINMHNYTISTKDVFNNNKNIFKNKSSNHNYIKINNIDYKSDVNKNFYKDKKVRKCNSQYNINNQLKNIHLGVKSLLDGLYNIYLNANRNENNII